MAGIAAVVAGTALVVIVAARVVDRGEPAPPGGPTSGAAPFPEGVFRYRLSRREVLRVVPDIAPRYLADAVGTFTWTLRNGVISFRQTGCVCSIPSAAGHYTIAGDRLTVRWPPLASNGAEFCSVDCVETVRWTFDGTALHIHPVSRKGLDVVFWGADQPWRQIGR